MDSIFIVEDDDNIRKLIEYALVNNGFRARGLANSQDFYLALEEELPRLIILDIMLPGDDGFTILEELRKNPASQDLPVIFLTAKTSEYHRIRGLDMGADDYILKPFSVMELVSRVRAVLRRYRPSQEEGLSFKEIQLLPKKRVVRLEGEEVNLTYKEFELLKYLMENKNMVLTRNMIMDQVWDFDFQGESRTIDVHIRSLRAKLGEAGTYIITVRNLGYKLGDKNE